MTAVDKRSIKQGAQAIALSTQGHANLHALVPALFAQPAAHFVWYEYIQPLTCSNSMCFNKVPSSRAVEAIVNSDIFSLLSTSLDRQIVSRTAKDSENGAMFSFFSPRISMMSWLLNVVHHAAHLPSYKP